MAEREPLILCVGHVAFRKGQPVLAKAFAIVARQFPAWRLLFLGPINDPICAKVVEEAAMQAGVEKQVAMMGSRNDTMEFMAKAAIYVQPSFFEGLPLSLQEGMFSGCACIGTDIPGNVELIEHEVTGLLVPCGQPKPLAQALTRIMSDVELRERLAARGQESIVEKGMTAQRMARQYDQLYQTVLAGRMNLAL